MKLCAKAVAISLSLLPSMVMAAEDCKPRVLHTLPLVGLRDSRVALPVKFGETPGALILDSAAVAQAPSDGTRKSVPVTGGSLEEWTPARASYAGIAGSLTMKTVEALKLGTVETGARYAGAGGGRPELKVLVQDFSILGLSPISTEFLVSTGDSRVADYTGTFAINNFRQFSFDLDLDFAGKAARLLSREGCKGAPGDWTAPSVARVPFTLDGNGYIKISVTIDGKEMAAVLDTGSVPTTLDFGSASRSLRVKENDPTLKQVSQMDDGRAIYSRPFTSIAFGDMKLDAPVIYLVPGIRGKSEGAPTGSRVDRDKRGTLPPVVVGMSVLRYYRVYFAYDEKALYFARSAAAVP